jgi:hypothetical protein
MEFLINYVKKTFTYGMDIGTVQETLQELDLNKYKPSLSVSLNKDEIIRMAEDNSKQNLMHLRKGNKHWE